MKTVQIIDQALLDTVSATAAATARRRKNFNFHDGDTHPCHRLLNAIEPDSYVAPHRHLAADKDETMVLLRGRLGFVLFDQEGRVESVLELEPGGAIGITIPAGTYHSVVALEAGTVFFESKSGPYLPLTDAERAPWAPLEGAPGVADYLASLSRLFSR